MKTHSLWRLRGARYFHFYAASSRNSRGRLREISRKRARYNLVRFLRVEPRDRTLSLRTFALLLLPRGRASLAPLRVTYVVPHPACGGRSVHTCDPLPRPAKMVASPPRAVKVSPRRTHCRRRHATPVLLLVAFPSLSDPRSCTASFTMHARTRGAHVTATKYAHRCSKRSRPPRRLPPLPPPAALSRLFRVRHVAV